MDFQFSEEQQMIEDHAREFAQRVIAPGAAHRDETSTFDRQLLSQLAENGFLGMLVPEAYGGSAMGYTNYVLVNRQLATACASTAVITGVCNLTASAIDEFGSEELKKEILPEICSAKGQHAAAFCLSEPHCGSDAAALKATARREGDEYILNGTKQWITNGAMSGWYLVMARTAEGASGISAFMVPKGTPGLVIGKKEDKMGQRGSDRVQVILETCRVPSRFRVGDEGIGFRMAMTALDGGRIGIGALSLGVGTAALNEALVYLNEREAFGKPLSRLQALQNMVADMATELEAAWLLTLRAALMKDAGKSVTKEASMAKVFASEACAKAVDLSLQIHGGYGYVKEYPIERLYRDARITRIYEGTSEIQRVVIAREVLNR